MKQEKLNKLSELKNVVAQLNCKFNEHSIHIPELVDTIIFSSNSEDTTINCSELAK